MTEPTPEQVEVTAKALEKLPLNILDRPEARHAACVALVAAAEVKPTEAKSSTDFVFDEAKLAEVILDTIRASWTFWENRTQQSEDIAHAVTEWLRGGAQ